jgi:hypothetical protein
MGRNHDYTDDYDLPYDDEQDDGSSRALEVFGDEERSLAAPEAAPMPSLVGVSATVTNYGASLLSYTRTMSRFYQTRRQVLSMGRHRCVICNERIPGWAWLSPDGGGHAHDGCYDRLAWAWANLYAQQQRMATRGELE